MEVKAGYKKTEVGVIPEDWQLRPMLSAVRVATGQVNPKVEPYRSMTLVAPDHIESNSGRLLKKETASEQRAISGKYLFVKGDIVYSKIRPYLRKAILADFDGLCSADMYPLKPASDVSAGFILAAMLGHHFSKYAESVSVRSGMPKINRAELAEYTIALPPTKTEQEVIAETLSDADALIESLEQLLAKKRHLKQGAMQELLTGKMRLPGFKIKPGYKQTEVGLIPEDWDVCFLRNVVDFVNGKPHEGDIEPNGQYSLITLDSIGIDGRLKPEHKRINVSDSSLKKNDIVSVLSDLAHGNLLGLCDLIPADNTYVLNQRMGRLRLKVPATAQFVRLQINRQQDHFKKRGQGTSQKHIYRRDFDSLPIPFPSPLEQSAIATILSDMDAEIAALEAKLAKTRLLKQGMMQELLTGRIRLV
ncbi:hypothetical protein YTPLAS72_28650 [Nitrospira sp.]|nr:hypothetical protein YTPLAS72_28650 [Nitrospira sp.]